MMQNKNIWNPFLQYQKNVVFFKVPSVFNCRFIITNNYTYKSETHTAIANSELIFQIEAASQ
jgi:hypothetical protein